MHVAVVLVLGIERGVAEAVGGHRSAKRRLTGINDGTMAVG